jgi:hypothetical protein
MSTHCVLEIYGTLQPQPYLMIYASAFFVSLPSLFQSQKANPPLNRLFIPRLWLHGLPT